MDVIVTYIRARYDASGVAHIEPHYETIFIPTDTTKQGLGEKQCAEFLARQGFYSEKHDWIMPAAIIAIKEARKKG